MGLRKVPGLVSGAANELDGRGLAKFAEGFLAVRWTTGTPHVGAPAAPVGCREYAPSGAVFQAQAFPGDGSSPPTRTGGWRSATGCARPRGRRARWNE